MNDYRLKACEAMDQAVNEALPNVRRRLVEAARAWSDMADRFDWSESARLAADQAKSERSRLRAKRAAKAASFGKRAAR